MTSLRWVERDGERVLVEALKHKCKANHRGWANRGRAACPSCGMGLTGAAGPAVTDPDAISPNDPDGDGDNDAPGADDDDAGPGAAVQESAQTAALSVTHAPIGKGGTNWITKSKPGNTGQLPAYIQNVRNAIMRGGKDESTATAIAIGRVRDWAEGKGKVGPEVKAAAAKAIAEFEAMRGGSHAKK